MVHNMPTYEIFIDGKPRKVELAKTSEKSFTAKIDDNLLNVELATDELDLEKFSIRINGKTYQIQLSKIDREKLFPVKVEETTFKAQMKTPTVTTKYALKPYEPALLAPTKTVISQKVAEGAVIAPMTGKVVAVKVKEGEQVKAGQVLCIVEAMKMENEITASKAGSIQKVNVSEGSPVNEGDVLFIIG